MKICIDYTCWVIKNNTFYGGGEYFTYSIIKELLLYMDKTDLTLLWPANTGSCNELQQELLDNDSIKVCYVYDLASYHFDEMDVLFVPNLRRKRDIRSLLYIKNKYPEMRIVLTIHDLRTHELRKWDPYGRYFCKFGVLGYSIKNVTLKIKWIIIKRILLRNLDGAVDRVLTVSNYSMQQILGCTKVKNISLVFQKVRYIDSADKYVSIEDEYFLFLSAGREEKNFLRTLDAYVEAVSAKETDYKMIVTGVNDFVLKYIAQKDEEYQKTVERMVVFKGYIPETEIQLLYAQCKALLFTSKSEGFGIPVLNASVYGRPVIASNRTSIPEILGSSALYIDPYDKETIRNAIRLISDKKKYGLIKANANKMVSVLKTRMENEMKTSIEIIVGDL